MREARAVPVQLDGLVRCVRRETCGRAGRGVAHLPVVISHLQREFLVVVCFAHDVCVSAHKRQRQRWVSITSGALWVWRAREDVWALRLSVRYDRHRARAACAQGRDKAHSVADHLGCESLKDADALS